MTRKIVEIETQLKILYEQQEILKQELSMKATLQAQQELTDIQMIIYEKKQVMSQLRTRMETVVDQKVEESLEEHEIDQLVGNIPIIVTDPAENSKTVTTSSSQVVNNQAAEKVKQTVTIETSKQEFIISQYQRRGVETAGSYQTVQEELAARFNQKNENSIERMEQRHRYQKLDGKFLTF